MRAALAVALLILSGGPNPGRAQPARPADQGTRIEVRGIYGGVPTQIFERGASLEDYGVNAIWIGSGSVTRELVEGLKARSAGLKVFAEFNTMHEAGYLKDHPDAFPIGTDGKVSPAPGGWQGVCPTHVGYRRERMQAFRRVLAAAPIDGIWLDYHHAHANWEQAEPQLPDTCFCKRCLEQFEKETAVKLLAGPTSERSKWLLGAESDAWVQWRWNVFTDWVREFRAIIDRERPGVLLGTFHCPWSSSDFDGAIKTKLAIDLKSQAKYLDVLSIMPYHARFGHAKDPEWISRQTASLGRLLGITGKQGERTQIWPIVQLSDWGESVPISQVRQVLTEGTRAPASGIMVFVWGSLHPQWQKVEEMRGVYRALAESAPK
jgi:hypothetical protein